MHSVFGHPEYAAVQKQLTDRPETPAQDPPETFINVPANKPPATP